MQDLFPETLLVARSGGHIYTTSRKVAEHFHKRHDHVMRDIQKVIDDAAELGISLPNFGESTYQNSRGKTYPQYVLDRKAFSILAGRLTGKQALRWQVDFYNAFEAIEAELAAVQARYLAALDRRHPAVRPVVEDALAGLPRAATAARLGRGVGSVTYHRRMARRDGLLPQRPRPLAVERDKFGFPLDAVPFAGRSISAELIAAAGKKGGAV